MIGKELIIPFEINKWRKLTDLDIINIREKFKTGMYTIGFLSRYYKVSRPTIRYWINDKYRESELDRNRGNRPDKSVKTERHLEREKLLFYENGERKYRNETPNR